MTFKEPDEPRFKVGDNVVYKDEVYEVEYVYKRLYGGEIRYVLKGVEGVVAEHDLEPYEPLYILELTIVDVGDVVMVDGYGDTTFEVVGVKEEYYYDKDHEQWDTVYTLRQEDTGAIKFAAEEDIVVLLDGLADTEAAADEDEPSIDALLDEINDYRRLREWFGDEDGAYAERERRVRERLAERFGS